MATDALIARGGKLAILSQKTLEAFSSMLPKYCSIVNPIDLLEEAKADRYKAALEACLKDENVDSILIIYTAQAISNPIEVARAIVDTYNSYKYHDKTILISFMGYSAVEEAKLHTEREWYTCPPHA